MQYNFFRKSDLCYDFFLRKFYYDFTSVLSLDEIFKKLWIIIIVFNNFTTNFYIILMNASTSIQSKVLSLAKG